MAKTTVLSSSSRRPFLCTAAVVAVVALLLGVIARWPEQGEDELAPMAFDGSPLSTMDSWPMWRLKNALLDTAREVDLEIVPQFHILSLATAHWKSEVLTALTKWEVFDTVESAYGKSVGCADVARPLNLSGDVLCRYMRAGAAMNLLTVSRQWPPGTDAEATSLRFALTPASRILLKGDPSGLRHFVLYLGEEQREAFKTAGEASIVSGRSGWAEAFGEEHAEWHAKRPERQRQYDDAMSAMTALTLVPFLGDWRPPSPTATICDVAGGKGQLLALILQHHPKLEGTLVEKPSVVERAQAYLEGQAVLNRTQVLGADILEPLPETLEKCNVFVLKNVLQDWDLGRAKLLLRHIKSVARRGSRLDIIENVLNLGPFHSVRMAALLDVHMQATNGGRERTLIEFERLIIATGIDSPVTTVRLRGQETLLQAVL